MQKNIHLLKSSTSVTRRIRNIAMGLASAGAIIVGGTSSALAFDDVIDEAGKIISCVGLLISDPELHAIECGVGDVGSFGALVPGGAGSPLPPPEEEFQI